MENVEIITINFDALYDNEAIIELEGKPILSFLSFYKAIGLMDKIREYNETLEKPEPFAPIDHLCTDFGTLQKIRRLIKNNWEHFNLDIVGDQNIVWQNEKSHDELPYARTLSKKIQASITVDFANFAPSLDMERFDLELGDDEIALIKDYKLEEERIEAKRADEDK